jgi:thiol-disulfide isomerase/thioredoxin
MITTGVVALSLLVQAQAVMPPQSPQDCLKAGREFASKRLKELGATTADTVRQTNSERLEMVRACAAQFDGERVPAADIAALIELYGDAQQPELVRRTLARGLSDTSLSGVPRANLLLQAVRATLREPKSAERNARAESYVDQLDSLGEEAIEQRLSAHSALNGYYRGDDIDAGIIKHSEWLIDTGRRLTPELRQKFGSTILSAYINLAEAVAGQGENDRAIAILERASSEVAVPDAGARLGDVLARYRLVGTAAPAIAAPSWLNRATTQPMDLTGTVTLLQFTAHWCGPCKESYPGMKRLEQRFGKDGLKVVFYTRTYGYFGSERGLTPEQEIERDRTYYAGYGFTLPIAIGGPSSVIVDGKSKFQKDPIEEAFKVGGIPQINVIDARGRIRLVMIGYDDANEEKLAAFIQKVIAEK